MPRNAGNSAKAERDKLRERMRGYGCTVAQIAAEMARRFNLRPRVAWRHALDWPQWKLALRYNTAHPGARLSDNRVSEFEADRCLLTTGHPPAAIPTATPGSPPPSPAQPGTQATVLGACPPSTELVIPADPAVWAAAMGRQLPSEFALLLMICLGSLTAGDGEVWPRLTSVTVPTIGLFSS